MKKIVTIGGGTGNFTVLRGIKNYDIDISAIVSMADDGEAQASSEMNWECFRRAMCGNV